MLVLYVYWNSIARGKICPGAQVFNTTAGILSGPIAFGVSSTLGHILMSWGVNGLGRRLAAVKVRCSGRSIEGLLICHFQLIMTGAVMLSPSLQCWAPSWWWGCSWRLFPLISCLIIPPPFTSGGGRTPELRSGLTLLCLCFPHAYCKCCKVLMSDAGPGIPLWTKVGCLTWW